jgi:predicted AlkP superfamily phosphohydrolase/phosphomutase
MNERIAQYREVLAGFRQGCLFFYFGATDLLQHMFWRDRDEQHPGRIPEEAERYGSVVDDCYVEIDELVGDVLKAARTGDTVIVLSDHGFNSFRRGFNLNRWLADQQFMHADISGADSPDAMFPGVDWSRTRAYGLGMNAVYVNIAGREKFGAVAESQRRGVLNELRDRLLDVQDQNGQTVISRVDLTEELYPSADPLVAPDLIVGYAEGYRASWETVLGAMPHEVLVDNLERWSGTHLISPDVVPGVLVANRTIAADSPHIRDIAATILAEFNIPRPSHMTGQPLFPQRV